VIRTQFQLINNYWILLQLNKPDQLLVKCQTLLAYHSFSIFQIIGSLFDEKSCLVFPSKKFDVVDILESIQAYRCNCILAFPKILTNLLDHNLLHNYDLSSLEMASCGGQLPQVELIRKFKTKLSGTTFTVGYGATEFGSILRNTINLDRFDAESYQNCIGKLLPFTECKIVDPQTGKIVPLNTEGELYVRTIALTRGYWNDMEITNAVIDENRWYYI
jgi:fatty-acyl-CoA synthase